MLQELVIAFARLELALLEVDRVAAAIDTDAFDERALTVRRELRELVTDAERTILARLEADEA